MLFLVGEYSIVDNAQSFTKFVHFSLDTIGVTLFLIYLCLYGLIFYLFLRADRIAREATPYFEQARSFSLMNDFGDKPALGVIVFAVVLVIGLVIVYSPTGFYADFRPFVSGAVTMQIIVTDILTLFLAVNAPFYYLGRKEKMLGGMLWNVNGDIYSFKEVETSVEPTAPKTFEARVNHFDLTTPISSFESVKAKGEGAIVISYTPAELSGHDGLPSPLAECIVRYWCGPEGVEPRKGSNAWQYYFFLGGLISLAWWWVCKWVGIRPTLISSAEALAVAVTIVATFHFYLDVFWTLSENDDFKVGTFFRRSEMKRLVSFATIVPILELCALIALATAASGSDHEGIAETPYYLLYLSLVALGFYILCLVEGNMALFALNYQETRAYWTMLWFADLPTFIGAIVMVIFIMVLWLGEPHAASETVEVWTKFVGGALVTQMLLANFISFQVLTNRPFAQLRKASKVLIDVNPPI